MDSLQAVEFRRIICTQVRFDRRKERERERAARAQESHASHSPRLFLWFFRNVPCFEPCT